MSAEDRSAPGVASLGAGRMGRGIALCFAGAGQRVLLLDAKPRTRQAFEALREQALADVRAQAQALVSLGLIPAPAVDAIVSRVQVAPRDAAPECLADVDLLFEGVPEVMDAKAEALALAGRWLPREAIVASTSSTFLSTALAALTPHPERFLNAHWLNPAHLIPLVEVSPHPGTDDGVIARLRGRLEAVGKVCVMCSATPGYIVPRLQVLIMNEAARMIESGAATAEDIDLAIRNGFGLRYAAMGVVEFIDVGGNDILHHASRYLTEALQDDRYAAPPIVGRHMAEGRNGLRDGHGFYDWTQRDADAYRRDSTARFVALLKTAGRLPQLIDAPDPMSDTGPTPPPT